jgi:hypothetical protein
MLTDAYHKLHAPAGLPVLKRGSLPALSIVSNKEDHAHYDVAQLAANPDKPASMYHHNAATYLQACLAWEEEACLVLRRVPNNSNMQIMTWRS